MHSSSEGYHVTPVYFDNAPFRGPGKSLTVYLAAALDCSWALDHWQVPFVRETEHHIPVPDGEPNQFNGNAPPFA